MITGTFKAWSINRFTLWGAAHQNTGILYSDAIQGAVPAALGKVTITDVGGTVIAGISVQSASYAGGNLWQYDAPAAMWTIQPHGGLSGYVVYQLVNAATGLVLHQERELFTPPSVATGVFTVGMPLTLVLGPGTDAAGAAYTTANTTSKFTVMHREYGDLYVDHQAGSAVGGLWQYVVTDTTIPAANRVLRVIASYYDLAGTTLLSSEVTDLYPE